MAYSLLTYFHTETEVCRIYMCNKQTEDRARYVGILQKAASDRFTITGMAD